VGIRAPWSRADALAAGRAFLARTGTLPGCADLHPAAGLPSYHSVQQLFGRLAGYHAALGAPPRPAPPPPAPVPRRVCLRCDRPFPSPHPGVRICPPCTRTPGEAGDVAWMNGAVRRGW
jgi:hypothetical protein